MGGEGAQFSGAYVNRVRGLLLLSWGHGFCTFRFGDLEGSISELPFKLCTSGFLFMETGGAAGGMKELNIQVLP